MRANANKRRQTLTNTSRHRGKNANKGKQPWANGDKRKQMPTPPIAVSYTPPYNPLRGLQKGHATARFWDWGTENPKDPAVPQKRAENGFGDYGFKHRTQWGFWPSPSSRERAQWVSLSFFLRQSKLAEFLVEVTKFAPDLSELSLPKQYSRNSSPPVSQYQKHFVEIRRRSDSVKTPP